MSAEIIVMFRCDSCNYTDSISIKHIKHAEDGGLVQIPNGWWAGIGTKTGQLKIFCAGGPCSPAQLANEVKVT